MVGDPETMNGYLEDEDRDGYPGDMSSAAPGVAAHKRDMSVVSGDGEGLYELRHRRPRAHCFCFFVDCLLWALQSGKFGPPARGGPPSPWALLALIACLPWLLA